MPPLFVKFHQGEDENLIFLQLSTYYSLKKCYRHYFSNICFLLHRRLFLYLYGTHCIPQVVAWRVIIGSNFIYINSWNIFSNGNQTEAR
mmetsp:Transcript_42916/g.100747  ORF Transcript_42916/g.100747 Transcript_42916/m.100747 type:complete len:89 (-) Transcript_42916:553-819(-)